MRDPTPRPNDDAPDQIRTVPSLRWLRMLVFRHAIVRDMVLLLAADGHRMAEPAHLAIKKIWLLLDLPLNRTRVALIHNREIFTDRDLYRATLFFVKLDMLFSDPITGTGSEVALRRLLLAQRSLSTLWRVLRRELLQTELDVLTLYVGTWYVPELGSDAEDASLLGIPAHLVGKMNHEGWGRGKHRLLRPDELVLKESQRRDLRLDAEIMDMMSYGFVDEEKWEFVPFPGAERVLEGLRQRRREEVLRQVEREVAAMGLDRKREKGKGKEKENIKEPVKVAAEPLTSRAKGKQPVRVADDERVTIPDDDMTMMEMAEALDSEYYSDMRTSALQSLLSSNESEVASSSKTPQP
ncbi:MAG: hypothetical protein M1822_002762 [Bathelium mastoideum]|nr:MAG: hypothetical protein M1822_002762 [Bathelium mastoideum]